MRQFAGRNRALLYQVVIGSVFLDNFSGKSKRIGRGQHVTRLPQVLIPPFRSRYRTFRFPCGCCTCRGWPRRARRKGRRPTRLALQFAISCVRVVGDLIGVQDVSSISNFDFATQMVDGPILLLLNRPDRDFFLCSGWRGGVGAGGQQVSHLQRDRRCGRAASGWLLSRKREADDRPHAAVIKIR